MRKLRKGSRVTVDATITYVNETFKTAIITIKHKGVNHGESSITVPLAMLTRKPNKKRYVCPTCSTKDKTVKHARPLCYGI